jgi:hypothetical protein
MTPAALAVRRIGEALAISRRARALLVAIALGTAAACSHSDVPLVGTWRSTADDTTLEFKSDGTMINADDNGPLFGGHYRFVSADTITVEFGGPAAVAPARTYKFVVAGDELTVTDERGKADSYQRVR